MCEGFIVLLSKIKRSHLVISPLVTVCSPIYSPSLPPSFFPFLKKEIIWRIIASPHCANSCRTCSHVTQPGYTVSLAPQPPSTPPASRCLQTRLQVLTDPPPGTYRPASRTLQTRLQVLTDPPPGPYRPSSRCLRTASRCLQTRLQDLTDPPPGSSSSCHSFPRGDVYTRLPWGSVLKTPDAGDAGSIPGWGRSPGEGNGSPFSIPAWRIPRTGEPGGLQSAGLRRAGQGRAAQQPQQQCVYLSAPRPALSLVQPSFPRCAHERTLCIRASSCPVPRAIGTAFPESICMC